MPGHRWQRAVLVAALTLGALPGLSPAASAATSSTSCLPASVRATLGQIERKFGRIQVVSTHRPGARIAGTGNTSYHASCRAADFDAPRGKHAAVLSWLQSNFSGGIGTYSCGMHHIHIDNGPHVRWHKCV